MNDIRRIVIQLSRFVLAGEVSPRAYAWLAESVIASSDVYERDSVLAEFADLLASYAPSGGEGLFGDEGLLAEAQRICIVLEETSTFRT